MLLGAHLGPRARAHIEAADVVFTLASDAVVELWLQQMNRDVRSLQPYYTEGKSRRGTYAEMVEAMLDEVRAGRRVCGAFYGHPGVFAQVPHDALARAKSEGFEACMEPGISAEDCLYADLGIDPGRFGCQHYEASQLLFFRRLIDPTAYLVLWQVGLAGDRSYERFTTGAAHRHLLVERLLQDYPADHQITIYEAATLPITKPRVESITLRELTQAAVHQHTTVVVPPARPMVRDDATLARLEALERALAAGTTASIRSISHTHSTLET